MLPVIPPGEVPGLPSGRAYNRRKKKPSKGRAGERVGPQPKHVARAEKAVTVASGSAFEEFLRLVAKRGVSINTTNGHGDTALIRASELGRLDFVQRLLAAGADAEHQNPKGRTAAIKAAAGGHLSVVTELINHGVNLFAKDEGGKTALDWARLVAHDDVTHALEKAMKADIEHRRQVKFGSEKLRELAAKGVESVEENRVHAQRMLNAVEATSFEDMLAVMQDVDVSRMAWTEAVRSLELSLDDEVHYTDVQTRAGWTPLTFAVANAEEPTVKNLIERSASLDLETKRGHTPLMWAAICGHKEIATNLIAHGATIDIASRLERKTALHHAAFNGQDALVELLVDQIHAKAVAVKQDLVEDAERNPDAKDKMYAAARDWVEHYMERLDGKDSHGRTALDYANERGHNISARLLECAYARARERQTYLDSEANKGRRVKCELGCGMSMRADRIEQHMNHECPRRLVSCPDCAALVPECEMPDHAKDMCPKRFVACSNAYLGCTLSLKFEDLELHVTHKCKKRLVECRLGCGRRMRWDERDDHEQRDCVRRMVFCPKGCGEEMLFGERARHIADECPLRIVKCRVSCGLTMRAKDREHHEEEICRRPCRWGCGAKIGPLDRRELHERFVCPKRLVDDPSGCDIPGITAEKLPHYLEHRCPKRLVPCPLGSGEMIASDEVDTWVHPEKGLCPNRLVRCRLDYVNKRLRVYSVLESKWEMGLVMAYDAAQDMHTIRFEGTRRAMKSRLKDLDFEEVQDDVYQCGWIVATDLPTHMLTCTHALVDCPFGSGQRVPRGKLDQHVVDRKRWLAEAAINDAVTASQRAAMASTFAVEQAAAAVAAASARNNAKWVAWEAADAAKAALAVADNAIRVVTRVVECKCGVLLLFTRLRAHRLAECPEEFVQCTQGCGQKVRRAIINHHMKHECTRRLQECSQGCGQMVFHDEQHMHNVTLCCKRTVECPAMCGHVCRAEELADHKYNCPRRNLTCGATTRQIRSWTDTWKLTYCPHTRETALTYAAKYNDMMLAEWLVEGTQHVDFEHETSSGETALTRACYFGHLEMVWFLCVHGANINYETARGRTALIEAARHNHANIVQLLLREQVRFEVRNKHKRTPIQWARACKAWDCVPLLHAVMLVEKEKRGLFVAIAKHDIDEVTRIVDAGEEYRFNHTAVLEYEQQEIRSMLEGLLNDANELKELIGPLKPQVDRLQGELKKKEDAANDLIVEADRLADVCKAREKELKHVMRDAMLAVGRTTAGHIGDVADLKFPKTEMENIAQCVCLLMKLQPERVREPKHNRIVERDSWWRPFQRLLKAPNLLHVMRFINKNTISDDVLDQVRICIASIDATDKEPDGGYEFLAAVYKWVKAIEMHATVQAELSPLQRQEDHARVESSTRMQLLWQERKLVDLQASRLWDLNRQWEEARDEYERNKHMVAVYREKLRVARLLDSQTEFGHTAMSWCCAVGSPEIARLLAKKGAPLHYTSYHMWLAATIIQCAVRHFIWVLHRPPWSTSVSKQYRSRELAHFYDMRSYVAKLRKQRSLARPPLCEAFYNGKLDIVKTLLNFHNSSGEKCGPHPSRCTWNRPIAPPPFSISREPLEASMTILDCARAGHKEHGGMHFAYNKGWVEAEAPHAQAIVRARALWEEVCETNAKWVTEKFAKLRVRNRVRKEKALTQQMETEIASMHFEEVLRLIDQGASIEHETEHGHTALTMASAQGSTALNHDGEEVLAVVLLLNREDDQPEVDKETSLGLTALMWAARNGHIFVIEALLDYHAEINRVSTKTGETALIHAAKNGKWESVRLLLESGADVHMRDNTGRTATDWAREKNFAGVMKRLSEYQSHYQVKAKTARGRAVELFLCSFGCGTMLPELQLKEHEETRCPKRVVKCALGCPIQGMWASEQADHEAKDCPRRVVPCTLNCGEEIRIEDMEEHQRETCRRRLLKCRVAGCVEVLQAKDLQRHEEHECKHRLVTCEKCGEMIKFSMQLRHRASECILRRVTCTMCLAEMWARDLPAHQEKVCPNRIVACKYNCDKPPQARNRLRHEASECINRPVSCPLGCGDKVVFRLLREHEKTECPNRFVDCGLGCGLKVLARMKQQHEEEECPNRDMMCPMCGECMKGSAYESHARSFCLKRAAPCGLGCGQIVVNEKAEWHRKNECTKRIVPCPKGCGKSMSFDKCAEHMEKECRNRVIFCKFGCGIELVAKDMRRHAREDCPMALIECDLGCGVTLRRKEMPYHQLRQCVRRDRK